MKDSMNTPQLPSVRHNFVETFENSAARRFPETIGTSQSAPKSLTKFPSAQRHTRLSLRDTENEQIKGTIRAEDLSQAKAIDVIEEIEFDTDDEFNNHFSAQNFVESIYDKSVSDQHKKKTVTKVS